MSLIFIILSSLFYLIGIIPYFYHVFHGRVVPHPFTWTIAFLFAVSSGYILMISDGVSVSLIPIGIRSLALLVGSILGWYCIRKISIGKIDIFSLSLAILIILLMKILGLDQAVFLMILIDILILTPTLKKIWHDPRTEDALAWGMTALSQIAFLLSLEQLHFSTAGYPLYIACINILIAVLIIRRGLYLTSWRSYLRKIIPEFAIKRRFW